MPASWHREEPRDVRPFFDAQRAEDAVSATGIKLFATGTIEIETSHDLDEIDFQKLEVLVYPKLSDPSAWMPDGLAEADLELVLIATHSFLKRSEVVERVGLSGPLPHEWRLPSELLERMAGGRNVDLTVALCLSGDRPPSPGSPFVVGHWLAKKTFALRSRSLPTLFDLRTRSDAEWVASNYPPKTLFIAEYSGGIADESDENNSVATVYIHIDAHNRLVSSALGDAFQPMLAAEIALSVLTESYPEWKDLDAAPKGSPLATLLATLGKENAMTLEDLKAAVAKPALARALLQDRLSVVQALR